MDLSRLAALCNHIEMSGKAVDSKSTLKTVEVIREVLLELARQRQRINDLEGILKRARIY